MPPPAAFTSHTTFITRTITECLIPHTVFITHSITTSRFCTTLFALPMPPPVAFPRLLLPIPPQVAFTPHNFHYPCRQQSLSHRTQLSPHVPPLDTCAVHTSH
ncbi:hypothetical protein AVEN_125974-1 [Araneus ventricosus]|uniref:Uncharacterized protein n=1 Tax=Araneus ventricosus TaxID=182803 RepID=A0A4Y2MN97_ARAVE|nr:hypothetical protein AVEN_125974-1 [Araneus ventricosus]